MPDISAGFPKGLPFLSKLDQGLAITAKAVVRMGDDPQQPFTNGGSIKELKVDTMFAGGGSSMGLPNPAAAHFHHPAGELDDAARARTAGPLHAAVVHAQTEQGLRTDHTSLIMSAALDGSWALKRGIARLPDSAGAAGRNHSQHPASA